MKSNGRELVWSNAPVRRQRFLKTLCLADPKAGKTVTCVGTAPGKSFVINGDQSDSLDSVTEFYAKARFAWSGNLVRTRDDFETEYTTARRLVSKGTVQTVIFDTVTGFSRHLLADCKEENDHGMKYYPAYESYLIDACERLLELPAHVIVNAHYVDVTAEESAEMGDRVGPGIVPMLETKKARKYLGAIFSHVVFMKQDKIGRRWMYLSMNGVWGPGCRGQKANGDRRVRANVKRLMRELGIGEAPPPSPSSEEAA